MRIGSRRTGIGRGKKTALLLAAAAVAVSPRAHANSITWNSFNGGPFGAGVDWSGGVVPGVNDYALFQIGTFTYTVSFTNNVTTLGMYVHFSDNVTWNLGGFSYTQTGSTAIDPFVIGQLAGDHGSLTINNGSVVTSASAGLNTVVGKAANSSGTVTLNAGASWTVNTDFHLGESGAGLFNQNGGTHTINSGNLFLGYNSGASGAYTLSNGTLALTNGSSEVVGNSGNGTFTQTGGTHTISSGNLYLGYQAGGSGAYTLVNGALTLTNGATEYIGYAANGTFNQSGGTHTISGGNLYVGYQAGGSGAYTLGNGALTLTNGATEYVGYSGNGTFNQSGGTHTISNGGLFLGYNAGGSGTYTLSNGTLALTNSSEYVGYSGHGTFNQNGGAHSVGGTLYISYNGPVSAGIFNLSGGTLIPSAITVGNSGTFTLAGGVLHGGLIDCSLGSFVVTGGTIESTVSFVPFSRVAVNGMLSVNGTLNNAAFYGTGSLLVQSGATCAASGIITLPAVTNAGTLSADGGDLSIVTPSFVNSGLLANLTGSNLFIRSSGLTHTGSILANSFGSVNFIAPITNIAGQSITLQGGAVSAPNIVNNGTITGFGQINGNVVNNGTASLIGPTQIVGNLTNAASGTVSITNAQLLITGSTVNNGYMKSYGNRITFNGPYSGGGTYNSDPADNYFQSDVNVGVGGQILGSVGDRFFVSGTYSNRGAYLNSGGTLIAQNVINNGQFNQTAGQTTLLNLSGTGSTTVGGAGTSLVSLTSFAQGSISIQNGGKLLVTGSTPHAVTNTVIALGISNNNALLDIDRQDLLIDNAATPFSTFQNYWRAGYNYDPSQGFGVWDGTSGITSSTARASHQVDARISVGYIDGAVQNDPNIGDLGIGLATNRILVRPALNGDLNLDGKVDSNDIGIIIGLGYYGAGSAPHGWLDGDINGDGVVDSNDIGIIIGAGTFNNGSYGPNSKTKTPTLALPRSTGGGNNAAKATPTLTGSSGAVAQSTTDGTSGNDFGYSWADHINGDLWVKYHGDTRITASNPLQRLRLLSASGIFRVNNVNDAGFNFETKSSTELDLEQTTSWIPDLYDLGDVLPPGADANFLLQDLTLQFNVMGGGLGLKTAALLDLPEPSTFALVGIGAIGLLARRRRTGRRSAPR